MSNFSTIKGFNIRTLASDPYATAVEGGTWASGGALNTAVTLVAGAGSQTAALSAGGSAAPGNTTAVELYDGTSWTVSPAALNVARNSAGGCGTQTAALFTGGAPGATTANEKWNGTAWSEEGDLTTGRDGTKTFGTSTAAIYAGGDTAPGASTADSETWNGSTWTEGSNLNTDRRSRSTGGTTTAGIYAGGADYPGSAQLTANETYDGTSWTEVADINTGRSAAGGSGQGTTTAFLMFGGALPASTGVTESWNGTAWTEVSDMGTARKEIGSGGTQLVAIAFGGYSPYYTNTEEFAGGSGVAIAQEGQIWYNSTAKTLKGFGQSAAGGTWASGGTINTAKNNCVGFGTSQLAVLKTVGEGGSPSGNSDLTETYDGTSWTEVNNSNFAMQGGGGFGTLTAGVNATGLGQSPAVATQEWDGSCWNTGNNCNTQRQQCGAFGIQTAGIIVGGYTWPSPGVRQSTESYNGTTWTDLSNIFNTARYQNISGGGSDIAGINAGGYATAVTAVTETWDGTSWTEVADQNTARGNYNASSSGTQSDFMIFGGDTGSVSAKTELWNGTSWTEIGDLATARANGAGGGTTLSAVTATGQAGSGSITSSEEFTGVNAIKTFTTS